MDDQELLSQYVDQQSEKAFADLVTRHIDLVYSTALRIVRDPGLAKDVTQSVFIQLAQKAPSIRSGHALPGWLYRVASSQAVNAVRNERTRREREMEAMTMKSPEPDTNAAWKAILPHLDDAMRTLKATEQNAIVLRFFEGRSWREVGDALSLNEDTAQKRVSRALDKLRIHFQRRGVVLSAVTIASIISANAAHAAPVGLASTVASASFATGAGSFSLSTYIHALIMKKTLAVLLFVVLAAAVITPVVVLKARKSQSGLSVAGISGASVRQGLILDYKFDHGVEDGQITDASSAGNNGQIVGAQVISDPQRGSVIQFSPPNQYILVPNNPSLNSSNITLAAWIKTSNHGDTWRRVFDKNWTDGFALSISGGHTAKPTPGMATLEICQDAKDYAVRSDHPVTDGQWHQVAVTYDGAEEVLYVDGVAQKRGIKWWHGSVPSNSHDLTIGINLIDPNLKFNEVGASFDGLMDEPMMFNRALSANEIKFLFNSQRK
ncbi:MAG TPA: sigma-70 family RNA polymerase sigma factor [Verrucomicrobiae bacterium]|jgi:RNA polymerase sigma factor (sigma-70 family)